MTPQQLKQLVNKKEALNTHRKSVHFNNPPEVDGLRISAQFNNTQVNSPRRSARLNELKVNSPQEVNSRRRSVKEVKDAIEGINFAGVKRKLELCIPANEYENDEMTEESGDDEIMGENEMQVRNCIIKIKFQIV